jgi:hypothetical protein
MSWQIPTQVEQDIISGKAVYKTFQTGNGGQSILPVPANSYVVIFGYDYSPAGGGFSIRESIPAAVDTVYDGGAWTKFLTSQISFYTGTDFYPFIHHVDSETVLVPFTWDTSAPDNNVLKTYIKESRVNITPIARQVYITSSNDVTITVGGIRNAIQASANAIPVTNRTPQGLTYGGSGVGISTQTNYGPGATPQQFMQPSPKDYQDFAFGLLPNNADGQAFATPDVANGLDDYTNLLTGFGATNRAASNYYLCLHYALYNKTIPETRG